MVKQTDLFNKSLKETNTKEAKTVFQQISKNKHSLKNDEYYTPKYAVKPLFKYISKSWTIWEPTATESGIIDAFKENGYNAIGTIDDFLNKTPEITGNVMIVTNPPYSLKNEFLKKAFELKIPFAMLVPLTTLESSKRQEMYHKYGIDIILLDSRVNYNGKTANSTAWFPSIWLTHNIVEKNHVENVIGKLIAEHVDKTEADGQSLDSFEKEDDEEW